MTGLSNSSPVLSVRELCVNLLGGSERPILREINLDVHRGEVLCVVGESGSGKSMLAYSIMGLLDQEALRPTKGQILLEDMNLLAKPKAEMRSLRGVSISMVFQEPMTALNPLMRVGNQVDEILKAHTSLNRAERRQKIIEIFREVQLPDPETIIWRYPTEMSGGQRQRVVIAMALILNPKLLIADEPTTALDVTTQKQIIRLLLELRKQRETSILFITHDLGVVAEIADRVVVMKSGEIVEMGTADQVLSAPQNDYTKALLDAVPSLTPPPANAAQGDAPAISATGLRKSYWHWSLFSGRRGTCVLKDFNVSLERGRTIGLVGESGSGKSTAARCLARLLQPDAGAIILEGKDVSKNGERELRQFRKQVQIVFQDPNRSLNPRIPVGESICEGPVNFGIRATDAREEAGRLLELVGLPKESAARFPHQFSGGQRQRIAIARALAMKPGVLIADEAVSALDVSVQAQVLRLLKDLQKSLNFGMIFITHDLRVAAQMCDELIVMRNGEIVETGVTVRLLTAPSHDYTKALLDAAPGKYLGMNNS